MIRPNLKDVDEQAQLVGTLPVVIKSVKPTKSTAGNPMLELALEVTRPNGSTAKRTARVNTDGKGAFRFTQLLGAVGLEGTANALRKGELEEFDEQTLVEQSCNANFGPQDTNPEYDEVKRFVKKG